MFIDFLSFSLTFPITETRSYSTPGTCCVSPESSRDVEETPGSQRNTAHSCGRSRKLERNLSSKSCPYSVYDNRILSQVTSPCTPQYVRLLLYLNYSLLCIMIKLNQRDSYI